jgi:adenylate kinase family enzyme
LVIVPPLPHPLRAAVVGITGSGKTTLARRLAHEFQIPHVELDGLYWGPNWTPRPPEVFVDLVAKAFTGESWVADGNYSEARPMIWTRANLLIWLDYSLPVVWWRLTKRIWRRGLRQEELWNGNRDRLWPQFFSRQSLYLWAFKTYGRYRRQYTEMIGCPEYAHLQVLRFKSPRYTTQWLAKLCAKTSR